MWSRLLINLALVETFLWDLALQRGAARTSKLLVIILSKLIYRSFTIHDITRSDRSLTYY